MADPTGARHRDFDIPVILPRFAFKELPVTAETPAAPTTATCAPGTTTTTTTTVQVPGPTVLVASTGVAAPVVKLGLPAQSRRRSATLRSAGLAFTVESSKPIADVEVRLVQLLDKGHKRPLGAVLKVPDGGTKAGLTVLPTPFARGKLALPSRKRSVRAIAVVTARDGSVGQASADFTLS